MSYSVNKVIILGNLTRDPELRYTQSGKCVARIGVATSSKYNDVETTEYHNVSAWEKVAELFGTLTQKGTKVYIEGRLQTREYQDSDGNQRKSTEIVVRDVVFLDRLKPKGNDGYSSDDAPKQGGYRGGSATKHHEGEQSSGHGYKQPDPPPYGDDQDIPF